MHAYLELLKMKGVQQLLLSSIPARLAYGMITLGIFFKVQQSTASISLAGLAVGLNTLASSASVGLRSSFIDKYGLTWPLRALVPSYAALIIFFNYADTKISLIAIAFILGAVAPPINLAVRPLWKVVIPESKQRTIFAIDTAVMSATAVIGPVLVTSLALSSNPKIALNSCAAAMLIGGIALALLKVTRTWIPEKKEQGAEHLLKMPAIRLLIAEGIFIGLAYGLFETGIPAFTTIEGVAGRTGLIFAVMAVFNIFGSLLAGLISKKITPLRAFRSTYLFWVIVCAPLAISNPDWTLLIISGLLGLAGGMQMVFYWEIVEAVRPKGTASSAIGWLWTFEGTAMALGSAISGFISEAFSPRYCLAAMSLCVLFGYLVIANGHKLLSAADRLPTQSEDEEAINTALDKTN
ncbi:MAG: MFS transporter [Actinobacteria bacterium]|jgi:MFS family permease|nr:MFS transporter [Actinomycetota bacterium]